jgi:ABC-2 type transport system ATP-binding protein
MSSDGLIVEMHNVSRKYRFFTLENVSLELAPGQIMGLVGPNGAGKSTTIRILMGLVPPDSGEVRVFGHSMKTAQALAKKNIGYVSDDMRLFGGATLEWHLKFVASIYPGWDPVYAATLLERFNLKSAQLVKGLSHGEHVKAMLLLVLARRPKLLVLDEPTTGLDPVARYELLTELMEVLKDESRSIIFSSHNTADVERISDQITFIDRGRIVDSNNKEAFLESWRRLRLDVPEGAMLPVPDGVVDVDVTGRVATVITRRYMPQLHEFYRWSGAVVQEVQRMTLEEIFVANVMASRKERVK